jgi:transposase
MYLRKVKVKDKKGVIREYLRIVKSYREKGKTKQKIIGHLGRIDLIPEGDLTNLAKKLAKFDGNKLYTEDELQANDALTFGPIIIIRKIWEELNLGKIIKEICNEDISERAFVLTSCRLVAPQSEHGLSYFLKEYFVPNNKGKRWEPEFREDLVQAICENEERIKVEWKKLQRWYRALDRLIENKEKIELEIYKNIRNLFSLKVDIVFYDTTSTYFEGEGPEEISKYGYSKDGKKDNKQILLGIVMADGLPIAHHVFPGNTPDKKTLDFVIKDLKERFNIANLILVADRGVNTYANARKLDEIGYKYILGVSLRNSQKAKEILDKLPNLEWKEYSSDTKFTFIKDDESWILVDSDKKREYEKKMREEWMEKGAKELDELSQRVRSGNLKDAKKIAYYLGGIVKKYHIRRYFSWTIGDGKFRFWIDSDKLNKEKMYEGKYLLRTTYEELTPIDVIREYKELWEIESCFRELKDVIKIRPIYHQTCARVRAHIFVAVIAYLIEKVLQRRISVIKITARDALKFSNSVKVVELDVGKRSVKLITQKVDPITERIYNLLGIKLPKGFNEAKIDEFTYQRGIQCRLFY